MSDEFTYEHDPLADLPSIAWQFLEECRNEPRADAATVADLRARARRLRRLQPDAVALLRDRRVPSVLLDGFADVQRLLELAADALPDEQVTPRFVDRVEAHARNVAAQITRAIHSATRGSRRATHAATRLLRRPRVRVASPSRLSRGDCRRAPRSRRPRSAAAGASRDESDGPEPPAPAVRAGAVPDVADPEVPRRGASAA